MANWLLRKLRPSNTNKHASATAASTGWDGRQPAATDRTAKARDDTQATTDTAETANKPLEVSRGNLPKLPSSHSTSRPFTERFRNRSRSRATSPPARISKANGAPSLPLSSASFSKPRTSTATSINGASQSPLLSVSSDGDTRGSTPPAEGASLGQAANDANNGDVLEFGFGGAPEGLASTLKIPKTGKPSGPPPQLGELPSVRPLSLSTEEMMARWDTGAQATSGSKANGSTSTSAL